MDYKDKYIKYKLKYKNFKNIQIGGATIKCPENTKLCDLPTKYMGHILVYEKLIFLDNLYINLPINY